MLLVGYYGDRLSRSVSRFDSRVDGKQRTNTQVPRVSEHDSHVFIIEHRLTTSPRCPPPHSNSCLRVFPPNENVWRDSALGTFY